MKVSRKTNERERDETSLRYDLRSLKSRADCALFSNPLDLLSHLKKYFTGVIVQGHPTTIFGKISVRKTI